MSMRRVNRRFKVNIHFKISHKTSKNGKLTHGSSLFVRARIVAYQKPTIKLHFIKTRPFQSDEAHFTVYSKNWHIQFIVQGSNKDE